MAANGFKGGGHLRHLLREAHVDVGYLRRARAPASGRAPSRPAAARPVGERAAAGRRGGEGREATSKRSRRESSVSTSASVYHCRARCVSKPVRRSGAPGRHPRAPFRGSRGCVQR